MKTRALAMSLLFAFGFWKDMGGLLDDIEAAAMYERHLGGAFETAGEAWGPNVPADWTNWRVRAPVDLARLVAAAQQLPVLIGHDIPSQIAKAGPRLALHSVPADFDAIRERALSR